MTDNLIEETLEAEAANSSQPTDTGRPPYLPEKFWDPATNSVRVEALAKSYVALERRLGEGRSTGRVPPGPDGYQLCCDHGLFTPDPDINARLHQSGFSNEQAQLLYDLAAERLMPMAQDMAGDFEARRQVDRLQSHFGGEEAWAETARQLATWGKAHLPAAVFQALSTTYEGVLALHAMMGRGEPGLLRDGTGNHPSLSEAELRKLMDDPRYWRDSDPSIVQKVRSGFQRLYPTEG